MDLKTWNQFICKTLKVTVWGRLPWSRYANTTLNHDNVSVYCALSAPWWKTKSQAYLWIRYCFNASKVGTLDLIHKMLHNTTTQSKQKICADLDHHWSKKAHFFVRKQTGFVHQRLRNFVKKDCDSSPESLIVTRVKSSYSLKNVTRVETPPFSTWLASSPNHQKSWLESSWLTYPLYTALLLDWRWAIRHPWLTFVNAVANSILGRFYTARNSKICFVRMAYGIAKAGE